MDITCARCRRSYFVPEDLVHGRTFRAKCSQCGHAFAVDVRSLAAGAAPRRAPAFDTRPSTSTSAIPGLADAVETDLSWLDDAAAAADAAEDEVIVLTVRRSRRAAVVGVAGGAVALLAATAGLVVWMTSRPSPRDGPVRPRAANRVEVGAAPVQDVGGLAAAQAPPDPGAIATATPDEQEPAPVPAPASRAKGPRLAKGERRLLDLLARKQDAKPVAIGDDEPAASARSALDPAAAEKVIAANRRAFDGCVSRALRLNPALKLARRATMMLTVQPDGRVAKASVVEEAVDRSDLGACLTDAARRMVFPAFDGEPLEIAMPLSLSATF